MEEKTLITLLDNIKCIRDLFKTTLIDLVSEKEKNKIYELLEKSENDLMECLNEVYCGR